MTSAHERDFYAPWSSQPDPVEPMTRQQAQEFGRKARERKGLLQPTESKQGET